MSKILKIGLVAVLTFLFIFLVLAVDFIPQGNLDLKGIFSIKNVTNITFKNGFFLNGSTITNMNSTLQSNIDNVDNRVTSVNDSILDAPKNWTSLQNYPVSCPDGTFITQINDDTTCTSISITSYDNLTIVRINVTNITIGGHIIWENGSGALIIE